MPPDRVCAGVELGGTKTIVLLARGTDILREQALPTEAPDVTLARASDLLRRYRDEQPLAAIGIASFGPLDLDPASAGHGRMLPTPKPGWTGADILGMLTRGLDCPVAIDTDVNGAALAETLWGGDGEAAIGDDLCYITIGTGVGGGLIVNGRPVHGAMHPEIGHIRVRRTPGDDFPGTCPFHGDCIEGLVSGPALAARFGMPGDRIPADDPRWVQVAEEIAGMICTVLLTVSVRRVLIGGGVGMARSALLPLVRDRVVEHLGGYLPFVTADTIADIVRPPRLGDRAGPLGAIALARMAAATPA